MPRCCQFSEDRKEPSAGLMGLRGPHLPASRGATEKLGDTGRAENWRNCPKGATRAGFQQSPRRPQAARVMRYLVKARIKPGREKKLLQAVAQGTLGLGSIAGDEYIDDMRHARLRQDGTAEWVEVCYCATPLEEGSAPTGEDFFDLISVPGRSCRRNCRHENGSNAGPAAIAHAPRNWKSASKKPDRPFLKALSNSL